MRNEENRRNWRLIRRRVGHKHDNPVKSLNYVLVNTERQGFYSSSNRIANSTTLFWTRISSQPVQF